MNNWGAMWGGGRPRYAKLSAEIISKQQREIAQLKAALELRERQIERLIREKEKA